MLKFTLTDIFLSDTEQAVFSDGLRKADADKSVLDLYTCWFKGSSRWTRPLVLRAFEKNRLVSAAILLECRRYGPSLFRSPFLYKPLELCGPPVLIWLRVGFGPEVAANPGFFAPDIDPHETTSQLIDYLSRNCLALFIIDMHKNTSFHKQANVFPYVDEGMVDISDMKVVQDYIDEHRNIKRKIKSFTNKGGTIEIHRGKLNIYTQQSLVKCCNTTMKMSFVYTPFQDAFIDVIKHTLSKNSTSFVHLIAKMNESILGYHSFVEAGSTLRMMHGAFNREMKTTYHSYENLIIAAVDHAIKQNFNKVFFGPIMNETKRRMMREVEPCCAFFLQQKSVYTLFLSFHLFTLKSPDKRAVSIFLE